MKKVFSYLWNQVYINLVNTNP